MHRADMAGPGLAPADISLGSMFPRWASLSLHEEMACMKLDSHGDSFHKDLGKAEEHVLLLAWVKALIPQTMSFIIHVTC